MPESNLLNQIMGRHRREPGELEAIDRRMHVNMAHCFDEVVTAVASGAYSKALLVLRKVGNTLRGSVYEQIQWAIDTLGVSDHWEATVSPMEIVNTRTGQKVVFRGSTSRRRSSPSS